VHSGKKKYNKRWLRIAYDGARREVLYFQIGNRSTKEFDKLFTRLEERYKIKRYYTDDYPVYKELIPFNRHKTGKKYTQQIENLI
jgi:IS1 family transposase